MNVETAREQTRRWTGDVIVAMDFSGPPQRRVLLDNMSGRPVACMAQQMNIFL